jgi:hypothetical protein
MKYHQYLKGNQLANSLRKGKLQLRVVQRLDQCFGDLKVLNNAMAKMLKTTKFCIWKVRKYLALRSANPTSHLETNKNHISHIESTLFVHESKQGPFKLNKPNKAYFAQQAVTNKKCTTKIV